MIALKRHDFFYMVHFFTKFD